MAPGRRCSCPEKEPGQDAAGIFAADKAGIDWADGLVAIMAGPAPDAGTCWEVGYAFGTKKSIVRVRTDFRVMAGSAGEYNPMLTQAATIRLDLPATSTTEVVAPWTHSLASGVQRILEYHRHNSGGRSSGMRELHATWRNGLHRLTSK